MVQNQGALALKIHVFPKAHVLLLAWQIVRQLLLRTQRLTAARSFFALLIVRRVKHQRLSAHARTSRAGQRAGKITQMPWGWALRKSSCVRRRCATLARQTTATLHKLPAQPVS
jgi:hypothetical protein